MMTKSSIQTLVETAGPSGFEGRVRELVRLEIEPFVDELRVDNLGNLIARKGRAASHGLRLMLSAHLDELGLIASHVDDQGFVRFLPLGPVQPLTCLGGRVRFLNQAGGVIGSERLANPGQTPPFEALFIDLGAASREDCPVRPGDVAVFDQPFADLGDRLAGKALNDRLGVAVLIEVLRLLSQQGNPSPHELHFVFSVQGKVGARGAVVAAYSVDPDLALVVDLAAAGDTPKGSKNALRLGSGPAVLVRDGSTLSDARLVDWMARSAEKSGLPHQLEISTRESSGGRAIQLTRSGVPVGCLSVPCRYLHTPSELVDYTDVQHTARLLLELLCVEPPLS